MITYLKGIIAFKTPTYIVVETAGVGYYVHISLHTYAQVEKLETVKILTHLVVREDSHTLYGFAEEPERQLFMLLISVSGIGPSTAQVMLSSMTPDEVRSAIISENAAALARVKGIGPKTAKRIILDLKDKLVKDSGETPLTILPQGNTIREEALSALVALGFSRIEVQKTLNKILKEQPAISNVEELIKMALRQLS
jgi:Holliday junction DNA helicase RuvA